MKRLLLAAMLCAATSSTLAADAPKFKNDKEKGSYALGLDLGSMAKANVPDADVDAFVRGIRDAMTGAKPALSKDEMIAAINKYRDEHHAKQKAQQKVVGEKNRKRGQAFQAENKKKTGWTTLDNGIQYKVLKTGKSGAKSPKIADSVTVHYRGKLIDGTEFDSSYKRGQPMEMVLENAIMGWKEILPRMKEGDIWTAVIPDNFAYGDMGQGSTVPPGETLIFEIELLKVGRD